MFYDRDYFIYRNIAISGIGRHNGGKLARLKH
jgi:hypothetical protein